MKKLILLLIFICLNFLEANENINLNQEEKQWIKNNPIVTFSEVNWIPLSIIKDNKMEGIMADYLNIISKKTGIKFKYIPSENWKDAINKFKKKEIDLLPGVDSSMNEIHNGIISDLYISYPMVIVTSTSKYKHLKDLNSLKNKTIAVPKYYTSYNFIKENYPKINIVQTDSITEALLLVEKERVDAFIGHIATSIYYMTENYLKNLKISGTTSFMYDHRFLLQKDQKVLLSIINKTIHSISYEEKKDIYSRWTQPTIIKERIDYTTIFIIVFMASLIIIFLIYRHQLLKKINQDMLKILNSSIDGVIVSQNNKCISINNYALKILEYDKKEFLGKNILDLVIKEDKKTIINNLRKEYNKTFEIKILTAKGKVLPLLIKISKAKINNKNVVISSFVDLTQTKQKEAVLYQQSKMAAMGEMIGNIAHQWRQPLSTISVAATGVIIQKEMGTLKDKDLYSALNTINDSSQLLSKIIEDFRNFFRPNIKEKEKVFIEDLINNTLKLIEAQFNAQSIHIIKNITCNEELFTINNKLIQVLLNILNNSRDALEIFNETQEKKLIFIDVLKEENYLVIKIYDNAGGIEEKIINRVFEPYFTTKHQAQGTGIGLYMTEELVTKHLDGQIFVFNKNFNYFNKNYKGACFEIRFEL
ncbi:hypothetical protein CP965_10780 [Halarcobacter mediterraneus]|uniref:histidine kinase n=1 Tax=Halarcobacter mediterraneus TaxID=2023153 RepID=A0A4Q1B176_9BACT|nr:transporter substrate-binding domain-containing protein [Halarcobacter mediterraneus]RXK12247.1 hypothetical protein CP965_10780 [Halarcobacter mediterraneus]